MCPFSTWKVSFTMSEVVSAAVQPQAQAAPPVDSPFRTRDPALTRLTELWLVSTVVTILGIRLFLEITNYPQVGGGTLHIAHMLYGGLGMLMAIGILLLMANPIWKPIAALVAGVGFGFFIDELGKFITQDNDYFFQPTIGLIYAVLVILFLIVRGIDYFDTTRPGDRVIYAIGCVEQLASGHLDRHGRDNGLRQLEKSGIDTPLTRSLREILESADISQPKTGPSWLVRLQTNAIRRYWQLAESRWLRRIVLAIFAIQGFAFVASIGVASAAGNFSILDGLSLTEAGALISGIVAGGFGVYGMVTLILGERLRGLRSLANATLVTLLFGQFFAFATVQFAALGNLIIQLVILAVLRFWIRTEVSTKPGEDEYPI